MQCRSCQAENREGRGFCSKCGAALARACVSCGFTNEPRDEFCGGCGALLRSWPVVARPKFSSPQSYTPKHLAEKILTSKSALEGERKQVTVLFADMKGSMELLADRDPEEARRILDPVLELMMEAVHLYEGTVNQVMGDGIMALFGAPVSHEDHAVRACYAALRMKERIRQYGDEIPGPDAIPLQIRVGLNSGDVVVRSIGNDLHMDYTAVGQTSHLAARMEQMAAPGSVLITGHTLQLAEASIQVKSLGRLPVKGLEAPVEVYDLVGGQSVRSRLQAAVGRDLSPFVGRDIEMEHLRRTLEHAGAGHGQVIALMGEPGVGKTRLVYEFTRSARSQEWLILETRAVSYLAATPYLPVIDLLKSYFQVEDVGETQSVRDATTNKMLALDEGLKGAVPPILMLLDALPENDAFRALDPARRRARTLDAIKHLILRESRRMPLMLVFENLHWIDRETQAFLDTLVEGLPTARLFLLVSYRPEYQHAWGSKTYYTQLPVEPLPPDSANALLGSLLGDDASLHGLKRLLIERTGGNPFFLQESVCHLVENQVLTGLAGAYRLESPLLAVQVPATVQAVLAARIDRLPPAEKRLLQAASVIGKEVPFPLLQAIADLPEDDLCHGLMHLQAAEFLYETNLFPNLEYTFKHPLTHAVVYGSLLRERRRLLHGRTVEAVEALYSDRLADHVERLAHDALQGELWEQAVTYCRQAGVKAAERSANREAVAYLEQALEALRRLPETRGRLEQAIDLRFALRPLLLQLGRLQEALVLSTEAEQLAGQLGDEPRLAGVYSYLINYHYLKGEPDRAIELGQRCLTMGEARGGAALQALARRYLGHCYHAQGRYRLAESILRQNVEALEGPQERVPSEQDGLSYVGSCGWLAFTLAELGEFTRAHQYLAKARRVAEASHHAYNQAIAWTLAGLVWTCRGDLEEAVHPLERSLETCREKHLTVWQPIPSAVLGFALVLLGRVDEGLPRLEDGVTLSEELGIRAYLALWTTYLGHGLLMAGQTERAETVGRHALDLARAHGERGHEAYALHFLGTVAAHRDPPEVKQADTHYRDAGALAHELGMRPLVAHCHLGLGKLFRRTDKRQEAQEHITTATTMYREMGMRFWLEQAEAEITKTSP
jgi:class 3 adenylate cyclase/tetratricopeptide (TPR) repeat protein